MGPTAWGEESFAVMRTAMRARYKLLMNLYTVIYETSKKSEGTVFRSLMTEFSYDKTCLTVDYQFMWGSSLMFTPIVHEGATEIDVYFPKNTIWYQLDVENESVENTKYSSGVYTFNADEKVPIFIQGGKSIVIQNMKEDDVNTVDMKDNHFSLLIAMDDEGNMSKGTVYIDDGLSVDADYGYVEISTELVSEDNYKISFVTEKKGSVDEISVGKIVIINDGEIENITFDTPLKLGQNDFVIYTAEKPDDEPTTKEPNTTTSASSNIFSKFTVLSILVNLFFK